MCGIAGIIGTQKHPEQVLEQMLLKQKHRGPDAMQLWSENQIALGHNRLAIVDLEPTANQPMHSRYGNFTIVFNGEIYNYLELKKEVPDYPFSTKSDTEVLLALFQKMGKNMLPLLNGMFSMVIYDHAKKQIFAARDRFGVKPFYFAFQDNALFFASEIKSLWAAGIPKNQNNKVWSNYVTYGTYGMPNETFWLGINQLAGGHYFETTLAAPTVEPIKWYDFVANCNRIPQLSEKHLLSDYFELLEDSLKLRFRADVPIGFNCSGGLDSSLLVALVNKKYPDNATINAFTFYSNDANYDELPWVKKLLEATKYPLQECLFDKDTLPQLISKVAYYQDEPFGGFPTMAYSNVFKKAQELGFKVLLDGQGMDEAWAGYDYYHNQSGQLIQGTTESPVRPEVFSNDFLKFAEKEQYPQPFESKMQNLQYRDLFYTKMPRALRFNDRNSMMYSTELREPFLDYRLVELAFAQMDSIKYHNGQPKWMLRQIATTLLGNELALAPKRPVQTPQREWIATALLPYMEAQIDAFSKNDFIDAKALKTIWQNYKLGNNETSFFIWQWINYNEILKATGDI